MVRFTVDGRTIVAEEGTNLLTACLDNDIYIPNLCFMEGMEDAPASCRMCLVEIEGTTGPVTSCTTTVRDGLVVRTDTDRVRRLQRSALRLLLSTHRIECARCPANRKCALQRIAKFLSVRLSSKGLDEFLKDRDLIQDHPCFDYYPNRCVLCGRCVYVCRRDHDRPVLSLAKRGIHTFISSFGEGESSAAACDACRACVDVCPVGALVVRKGEEVTNVS